MFSSSTSNITNNETPSQIRPYSFFDNEDDMFVHQDFTTQSHFFPNVAVGNVADFPPLDNFNEDIVKHDYISDGNMNPLICDPLLINLLHPRWKKPDAVINKHRHRKIVTAQGSRDRRVRLSIQIARRFFDLQDNLGFDKASQTIDWLLNKSKTAIDEEKAKIKQRRRCTIAADELEKDIQAADEIGSGTFKRNSSVSSSTGSVAKEIGISMQQQHPSYLAKELRAKARERARERTKAKMSSKKLIQLQKLGSDFGPIIPNPNSWNQLSSYKKVPYFSRSCEMNQLTTTKFDALNQQNVTSSRQVLPSFSTTITENWEISNDFSEESPSMAAGYGNYVYD